MCAGFEFFVELQMDQMPSLRTLVSREYEDRRIVRLLEEDVDPLLVAEDELQLFMGSDQDVGDRPETLFFAVVVGRGVREQQEELLDESRVDHLLSLLVGAVGHIADDLKDLVGECQIVRFEELLQALETPALDQQSDAVVGGEVEQRRENRVERGFVGVFFEHFDESCVDSEAQLELLFERAARSDAGQGPAGVLGDLLVGGGHELVDQRVDDVGDLQPLFEGLVFLRDGADGPGALFEDLFFVAADDLGEGAEEAFVDERLDAGLGAAADVRDAPASFELG